MAKPEFPSINNQKNPLSKVRELSAERISSGNKA
jgi:hypothetical protein